MLAKKKRPFGTNETLLRIAVAIAAAAGALCLLTSSLLILNYRQVGGIAALERPELAQLRSRLTGSAEADAEVIEAIRALDLLARGAFFTSQEMLRLGGGIALTSALVFLLALRVASRLQRRLPTPSPDSPRLRHGEERAQARELLTFMGGLWLFAALLAAAFTSLDIPVAVDAPADAVAAEQLAGEEASAASESDATLTIPSWEEVQLQWPSFRGPGGLGVAHYTTAPVEWDAASGKNILWKTEVPLPGFNSPVVWDKRVYLSGADAERREVYCFDADTGALLWQTSVGARPAPAGGAAPKVSEDTGWAASTLAVQGDAVCAIFASGHLACLDGAGTVRWEKHLGVPDNHYGHSSSLLIFEQLLLVQYDQRQNGALYAFDLRDGAQVWKQDRSRISWASPVLAGAPETPMLAVVSTRDLDVYNPRTGGLLWTIECLSGEVGPSPAYGAGMFFVANDYADASAVRPPDVGKAAADAPADGKADEEVGAPEIVWQFYESLPDISSPLAAEGFFYLLTSRGEIICLRSTDGEVVWLHEHDEGFHASPILVGDRVYALDVQGVMLIFKHADAYEQLGAPRLDEATAATPAFLDGRLYARTKSALVCIGER